MNKESRKTGTSFQLPGFSCFPAFLIHFRARPSASSRGEADALTLVEILVVIAIVGVLAGLALPVFQRLRGQAHSTVCVSNLRQLGTALGLYLTDNNQVMPTLKSGRSVLDEDVPVIDNTLDRYTADKRVFLCPADMQGIGVKSGTSYYWNVALNGQPTANLNFLAVIQDHSRIPILADKEGFHLYSENKVNLLYADGHATRDLSFFTTK